jgi:hypothetical protein
MWQLKMTNAAKEWVDVGTVFACDDPDARQLGLDTMYEVTPQASVSGTASRGTNAEIGLHPISLPRGTDRGGLASETAPRMFLNFIARVTIVPPPERPLRPVNLTNDNV